MTSDVIVTVEDEMKSSYINYAMSVIIGRAIPDVRDGLKPVHRRTLFAMWEMGNTHNKPFKKSARVVGDVMGKFHPHGDAAIYDALVKMAQDFTYRRTLVEGQGNFGSVDGDAAAAMRYTEVRLSPAAEELLIDLDKETVDFGPNFDESLKEPLVLPSKIPNLLVNGSSGIAVGMATNMPPHNPREVCDAVCLLIDKPSATVEEIMKIIRAPDFPTGGVIMGTEGIREAYHTGHGKCIIRGITDIESEGKSASIIITEIPFQVNKSRLVEQIADLVKEKKVDGIYGIRDESDKDGIRVVIDLRRGAIPAIILNQLYKHTQLEVTYGINNLAIVDGQPKVLPLPDIIRYFIEHRVRVVKRRSAHDLKKIRERVHILDGFLIALKQIDKVVSTIRSSDTAEIAKGKLIAQFSLDELQADAILKMQLRSLAALEVKKIQEERDNGEKEMARLRSLLSTEANLLAEVKRETKEMSKQFGDPRRTRIEAAQDEMREEDLIENRQVFVSITAENYIKRIPIETYRKQHRGGKGVIGLFTREEDDVIDAFVASMLDYLLCFTNKGRVYWLKVYDIPESSRIAKGKSVMSLLPLSNEKISAIIPVKEFKSDRYLVFATKRGMLPKIPLSEFSRPRQTGILAVGLRDGDELVDVKVIDGAMELILTTKRGRSLRFNEKSVSLRHRGAYGVIGIRMKEGDAMAAITIVQGDNLLTITESGYGKRTEFSEFMGHGRGTSGVLNIKTERTGDVIAAKSVSNKDEIILMSAGGTVMRTHVSEISIRKRNTRGVRIMSLKGNDRLVGIAVVQHGEIE